MSECKHEFSTAAVYDRVCEFCYRLELKIENEALKQRVSELQRDYQMLEAIQAGDGVIINTYKNRVSELEKENTRWAKVADAQAAEIAALREVNEWISVEDRLPEKNITILIYSPATVYFGWVGDDNRFQTSTVFLDDATLWKPITPPKGIEI